MEMFKEKSKKCFIKNKEYKCRTCFEPSGVIHELDWVFEEFLKDIIKLKDRPDDRLPNTMCSCCLEKLNTSVTFIAQVKVINENFLKLLNQPENADCLQEHTIDMPVDDLCIQYIKLEEIDITDTVGNYSEVHKLGNLGDNNVNESEAKILNKVLKLNRPQRKHSEDIKFVGSLKNEISEAQTQESSDDDNSKYVETYVGQESSSDEESLLRKTKKKRKLEKKSSPQNTKNKAGRPAKSNFDKIKEVNGRFICYICEKSFSHHKHCVRHITSIHFRDDNITCEFCGNNFSRKDKLNDHIKRKHSADNAMKQQQQKNRKQNIIYGDRLYGKPCRPWQLIQCKICDESAFKNNNELRSHLQLHKNKDSLQYIDEHSEIVKTFFANNLNLDNIKDMICNDLDEQKLQKYYNIINDCSWEMSISDTEPEDLAEGADRKSKYSCQLCDKQFQFKYAAFEHQKTHVTREELMPFKCDLCKLEFLSSKMYESHCQNHCHNKHKMMQCANCPAKFAWAENMKNHKCALELSAGGGNCSQTPKLTCPKVIQCGLCNKSFETLLLLRLHLPIHADGTTAIDLSNSIYIKRFERSKNLNLAVLQNQIQYNFKRQQIARYYRTLDKNGNEMDIFDSETDDDIEAEETYTCTLCSTPADFKRRKDLLAHQHKNHSNATLPFECENCAKQFISDCLLQKHLQRECANEFRKQAQQCEYCEKRLIWPNNMTKHKKMQHENHTLKCEDCDKTFSTSKDLVRHRKIHIDGKKFSCPQCERKFQRKDNLKSHMRMHESQMVTSNATTNNSNRTTEQILPHLGKPNGCKIIKCMLCYTEHNKICDLRSHLKSHQFEIDLARHMQDNEQISDISKLFYPDELPILTEEELQKKILHDIACDNNLERFYSITNEHGYEIHLESSQTESESEEETESNEIEKINCKRFYNCDNCADVTFTRKYQLYDHQLNMHKWEEARHSCMHCNARFLSSYLLKLHYKRQCKNSLKKFLCKQCPLRFMWKNNLQTHLAMDHASELEKEESEQHISFDCLICQSKFYHQRDLSRHMNTMHQSIDAFDHPRFCLLCCMTFYNIQHLNEHLLEIHHLTESDITSVESLLNSSCWPNGTKKIECMKCRMKFHAMHELRQHQSISSLNSKNICHTLQHSIRNYSIVNKKGFELNLELDSETDNDNGDDQEDDIEPGSSSKPYTCALCNWSCKRKYQMMQHQRSHHEYEETKRWKCENCLFSSVCEKILDHHKRTQCFNLDKKFQCIHCNFKFMWPENLEKHILMLHATSDSSNTDTFNDGAPTTQNIFECMECHRQYNRKDRYRDHFNKFHNIKDKATLKDKQTKSELKKSTIKNGLSKKEGKSFLCPFCGISFTVKSNLTVHMRRHTGERPFKCDLCEMAFPRSTDLKDHRRSHTGEKPYKCYSCDKSFSRHYKLRVHNRTHTGERPFHCTFCDKTFVQSIDLNMHLKQHTGEPPYLCSTCGEGFTSSTALKTHQSSLGHLAVAFQRGDVPAVNLIQYHSILDSDYNSQY